MTTFCEICRNPTDHPKARYCKSCKKAIKEQHKILMKGTWQKAVEIIKMERQNDKDTKKEI